MNLNNINKINSLPYYIFISIFAFFINYWVASRGVFPIDTFVHYDSAARILIGEMPIKDFWIVHGLLVDFIQSIFFKFFGINWNAYVIHASVFNLIVSLFTFKIFQICNIKSIYGFFLTLCFSVLAYPVSGTPFLDLHSVYFSLIAIYFLILSINKSSNYFITLSVLFFGFAFLCKQVPAAYTIICITLFLIYYSLRIRKLNPIKFSLIGISLFLFLFVIFLMITEIQINDLFFQLFIFPSSIAQERYSTVQLNINNIFLDYKLIYFFLLIMLTFLIKNYYDKRKFSEKDFYIYIIIFVFCLSIIYHQIFTKNQIFIFFIIPVLCAFSIKMVDSLKLNKKEYLKIFLILICLFSTFKYHERFNIDRKFHELVNTNLKQGIQIKFAEKFFKGLKWITPNYENPKVEMKEIKSFYNLIKKDKSRKMLISNYTFYSALLNQKLYSPSRTYDQISYPQKGDRYFKRYKFFFKNNITKNKIQNIYIFYTQKKINTRFLEMTILNYLPSECIRTQLSSDYVRKFKIIDCEYLNKK
tara:strand:- start:5094 stop:6680 length:1587 start_codon:yes stop_codon:yes gene_type:complete